MASVWQCKRVDCVMIRYIDPSNCCLIACFSISTVPTLNDVLVPETLAKKQAADKKAADEAAAKKPELVKASIMTWKN